MRSLLAAIVAVATTTACGSDHGRRIEDAPSSPRDAAFDGAPDAGTQCTTYVAMLGCVKNA
ncbi:MAG TPA: hypothetical protein VFQ65_05155 [Kofleriaceae bacterium]|nr:hypothetical protein [Kofleriaceae bacterium]